MAWTTPRTWVTGEVITAALFNAQLRDNFLFASTHAHSGAVGDGSDQLSGVNEVDFDHIGDPAAPGAGQLLLYTKTGGVFFRDGAAGAVTQLSDVSHDHTFVEDAVNIGNMISGGDNLDAANVAHSTGHTHNEDITVTPTENAMVVGFASAVYDGNNTLELFIDGVSQGSTSSDEAGIIQGSRAVSSGALTVRGQVVIGATAHVVGVAGTSVII